MKAERLITTIWIVFENRGWDGQNVLTLWSSQKAADHEVKRLNGLSEKARCKQGYDTDSQFYIEPYKVGT